MKLFKRLHFAAITAAAVISSTILFSSCSTVKQVIYFQDLKPGVNEMTLAESLEIKVRPADKLSILINSKDPMLSDLFNLPYVARQLGSSQYQGSYHYTQGISGYTVDSEGFIDFPILGKLYVEGMKREEVASCIKEKLITNDLIKDPVVTVEYMNLTFGVMGEVKSPGRFSIDRDQISILDALTMAGDLTIYGNRKNVLILREENGVQKFYRVNLCNAARLCNSPVYYIRQNDIIYVEPNKFRARVSTVNGNNWSSTSFWISLGSLLVSIASLVTINL